MLTLFLDLASHEKTFIVADDNAVKASATIADRTPESELMPILESVCKSAGIALTDIHRICSVVGPGGFMSLRVATAFANALSFGLRIPLAGIHLSDVWRARIPTLPLGEGLGVRGVLWLHSTKKDALFVRGFGALGMQWQKPTLISAEELRSELIAQSSSLSFVGELIPEHVTLLRNLSPVTHPLTLTEVVPILMRNQNYTQKSLEPWYGRGA